MNGRHDMAIVDEQGRLSALEALHERWKRSDGGYKIKIVDLILGAYENGRGCRQPRALLTGADILAAWEIWHAAGCPHSIALDGE